MASTNSDVGKGQASSSSAAKQPLKAPSAGKSLETSRKQNGSPVDPQHKKQNSPSTKAWQGPNPITSRSNTASPLTNGVTQKPSSRAGMEPQTEKHAHARLVFLLANMTGCDATVTLKNGEQFTGVFSGGVFEPASKASYTFKMVKRVRLPSHQQVNGGAEVLDEYTGDGEDHIASFDVQDTIDLAVNNVTLASKTAHNGSATSSFRTDTEISGPALASMPRARELQRWEPGPADMSLDDMAIEESGTNGWDQFAANEQKYGVKTTYDEDIYTTAIDKSHPEYKKRAADADRLAREIEGSTASNAHIAEERRTDVHGPDDGDEEDKYSGVRRDVTPLHKGSSGSYVPPSRRPITNTPTVPGAPFDPAIISSQIAQPQHTAVDKAAEPKTEDNAKAVDAVEKAPSPNSASKISPSTTEDRVRDSADAFKQFASNEKMRLRQAQEQKRTNARNEKNVRINDLKKFAENFKLKSRVPDDLISILAKDHEKQLEIKRKAEEAARTEEQRVKDPKAASPSSSSATAQTSERNSVSSASSRPRVAQNRSQLVPQPTPGMSRRQIEVFHTKPGQRSQQPVQTTVNIPTGPAAQNNGALSPAAVKSLNVNAKAFEFRPAAHDFTPTGVSPSPQRLPSVAPQHNTQASFFSDEEKSKIAQRQDSDEHDVDVIAYLQSTVTSEEQKKALASTGGVPQPYRTNPTWTVPEDRRNTNYEDLFPKPHMNRSPLHTPNGQMPHTHQLPPNMQPNMQGQRFYPPQQGMPQYGQSYDPRFQPGGPGASVQRSPRIQQAQIPFGAQMGHMPQFSGQPMPVYGMSPSMSQRPLHMPGGAPMMMPQYSHGPGAQMRYGQYPQMMGSQGPNGFGQGYSLMPQHAAPHLQHMPMQPGFAASPRPAPHMMQHGGSHQGFQSHQMMFTPGQPSPYAMNQRQMSSGQFSQATPRQQQALPVGQPLPGPGMNGPPPQQGDEGK